MSGIALDVNAVTSGYRDAIVLRGLTMRVAAGEAVSSPSVVEAQGRFVTAWTDKSGGAPTARVRY